MLINHVQTNDYIIEIEQMNFTVDHTRYNGKIEIKEYTNFKVSMTRFDDGCGVVGRLELLNEYRCMDRPDEVMGLFVEAWDCFMEACRFCNVSPVSDGTCIDFLLKIREHKAA